MNINDLEIAVTLLVGFILGGLLMYVVYFCKIKKLKHEVDVFEDRNNFLESFHDSTLVSKNNTYWIIWTDVAKDSVMLYPPFYLARIGNSRDWVSDQDKAFKFQSKKAANKAKGRNHPEWKICQI